MLVQFYFLLIIKIAALNNVNAAQSKPAYRTCLVSQLFLTKIKSRLHKGTQLQSVKDSMHV